MHDISIQHVVQSGARLTVAHCPRGSVHTSASGAPEMRSRSAGRPHNTKVRTANQRRAHQPSARPEENRGPRRIKRRTRQRRQTAPPASPPPAAQLLLSVRRRSAAPPRLPTTAACSVRGSSQRWHTQYSRLTAPQRHGCPPQIPSAAAHTAPPPRRSATGGAATCHVWKHGGAACA